jgi:integrase
MPKRGDRITKRKDGRYMARYTVQTPDGSKRKTIYGRKYKEVERKLAEAMGDAAKGIVFDSDNLKLGKWLDSWLDNLLKPLVDADKMARSTYLRYEGIANNHLKPALGHRKLKDLTRAEVRRLYTEKGKTLSPRSVDYIHATLQKALSQAVRDDLVSRNVASGERPRSSCQRRSEEAKALSSPQVKALLMAARGQRNEAPICRGCPHRFEAGQTLGAQVERR